MFETTLTTQPVPIYPVSDPTTATLIPLVGTINVSSTMKPR